jgi:hypothetical protein
VTGDWFFALDDAFFDGGAATAVDVSPSTRVTGNSMRWMEDDRQLHIFGMERDIGLRVAIFDENLALVSLEDRPAPPAPRVGWWASGIAPVGGGALLVHMAADPAVPWNLDTGDVALVVLGPDLTVLEQHALTQLPPPNGAMRPGIAVEDDTVVVSFDVGGAIQLQRLRIDRAAFLALDAEAGGGGADEETAGGGEDGGDSAALRRGAAPLGRGCDAGRWRHTPWLAAVLLPLIAARRGRQARRR